LGEWEFVSVLSILYPQVAKYLFRAPKLVSMTILIIRPLSINLGQDDRVLQPTDDSRGPVFAPREIEMERKLSNGKFRRMAFYSERCL